MWNKLKSIIGTFAPIVASALGSPLAGVAVSGICKILGLNEKDNPLEEDVILALKGASPEAIIAIQKLGIELQEKLAELEVTDRASAREREVKAIEAGSKQRFMPLFATFVTVGFFAMLSAIYFLHINVESRDVGNIMLGSLATAWISIVSYYFGSSHNGGGKRN